MRRLSLMVMMWAALAMPVLAMADGQTVPPETNRTPTPPARSMADVNFRWISEIKCGNPPAECA